MKKLLVLTLFLAIGAYASAGLEWVMEGSTAPNPGEAMIGDVLSLKLMTTDNTTGLLVGGITDNGAAGGLSVAPAVNAAYSTVAVEPRLVADFEAWLIANGVPAGMADTGLADNDAGGFSMGRADGGVVTGLLMELTYVAGDVAEDVEISLIADPTGLLSLPVSKVTGPTIGDVEIPGIAFTVVPEPMTLGLLGLGALFLRRRK